LISGFRRDVDEICALLGYSDSWPVKMGPTCCTETSVSNYHTTPRNIENQRRSHPEHLFTSCSTILHGLLILRMTATCLTHHTRLNLVTVVTI
jgi:hypothetical protein